MQCVKYKNYTSFGISIVELNRLRGDLILLRNILNLSNK